MPALSQMPKWLIAALAVTFIPASSAQTASERTPLEGQNRRPLRKAESTNGRFRLELKPSRDSDVGHGCVATLSESGEKRERWTRTLVNETAPVFAAIRDDGKFTITLDEARYGGARNALVIYGERGELLRHFLLPDLLSREQWKGVSVSRRSIDWLENASYRFTDSPPQFALFLSGAREVRIDLKKMRVMRAAGPVRDGNVPAEFSAAVFGSQLEPDAPDSGEDDELSESPEMLADIDAIRAALQATDENPGDTETLSVEQLLAHASAQIENLPPELQDEVRAELERAGLATQQFQHSESSDAEIDLSPNTEQYGFSASTIGNLLIETDPPAPNPSDPVNYVEWLNGLGRVDGPDASPLYDEAIAAIVSPAFDQAIFDAAMSGDAVALESSEIQDWLSANALALDKYRQAAHIEQKSWNYAGEDGRVLSVLLPSLAPLRQLARTAAIQGKMFESDGRGDAAASIYLDMLNAGAHNATQPTLIEGLVGAAVQNLASESLLDLAAGPAADDVDYEALAARLDQEVRDTPSISHHIGLERAAVLGELQRMWKADPDTGQYLFDPNALREFTAATQSDPLSSVTMAFRMSSIGFEKSVADVNDYYDDLARTADLPWTEARSHFEELESQLRAPDTNPALQLLAPALSRAVLVSQRTESTRRASAIVANIMAHKQRNGSFPESLDTLGDRSFLVDPISNQRFGYRKTGDGFTLYSLGDNGVDDGGVHDPKGETNDRVFWPRPQKK